MERQMRKFQAVLNATIKTTCDVKSTDNEASIVEYIKNVFIESMDSKGIEVDKEKIKVQLNLLIT